MDERPLFTRQGESYFPSESSRGPWRDDALHGGPVAGLVAREAELHPSAEGTRIARITVELLRPVKFVPLTPRVELIRAGKAIRLLRVELFGPDGLVTLAHVLCVADEKIVVPTHLAPKPPADLPGDVPVDLSWQQRDGTVRFHTHAAEMRVTVGAASVPGAAAAWFRLRSDLLDGEPVSPAQRAAVVADLGGIGSSLSMADFSYPNADLSIHLHREPVGEWLRIDSASEVGPLGVGLSTSVLSDAEGRLGQIEQTQIIKPRG
jgi:hypothetical protein